MVGVFGFLSASVCVCESQELAWCGEQVEPHVLQLWLVARSRLSVISGLSWANFEHMRVIHGLSLAAKWRRCSPRGTSFPTAAASVRPRSGGPSYEQRTHRRQKPCSSHALLMVSWRKKLHKTNQNLNQIDNVDFTLNLCQPPRRGAWKWWKDSNSKAVPQSSGLPSVLQKRQCNTQLRKKKKRQNPFQ